MTNDTNLLPAILLAAPPHSGKSVLAYLLSKGLRSAQAPHILLRAAPDGEGDYSYESPEETRYRLRHKGDFSPELVARMQRAIRQRILPMLVDIGGRPQDDQFEWLAACTHVIQLYREEEDRVRWANWLERQNLITVAELRSQLAGPEQVLETEGVLRGTISGLERSRPQPGRLFELLLQRVQGICSYPAQALEAEHLRRAPAGATLVTAAQLAAELGIARPGQEIRWEAGHLPRLFELIPPGQPLAVYGRGPVWLYAALAAHAAPASFHLFDARHYGWMAPPDTALHSTQDNEQFSFTANAEEGCTRLQFQLLRQHYALTPELVHVPAMPVEQGVLLDGPMPNWLWAALARSLRHHPWLAAREPRGEGRVLFWQS